MGLARPSNRATPSDELRTEIATAPRLACGDRLFTRFRRKAQCMAAAVLEDAVAGDAGTATAGIGSGGSRGMPLAVAVAAAGGEGELTPLRPNFQERRKSASVWGLGEPVRTLLPSKACRLALGRPSSCSGGRRPSILTFHGCS